MAKKDKKKKKKSSGSAQPNMQEPAAVTNPELKEILREAAQANNPMIQARLADELRKAVLLVPGTVETVRIQAGSMNSAVPVRRVNLVLLNTKDGHSFIPAFTDAEEMMKAGIKIEGNLRAMPYKFRQIDDLLQKNGNATGLVLNPSGEHIMLPKESVGLISGSIQPKPVPASYGEPAVYPTRMDMAVYDWCREQPEISRVWLKEKRADGKSFVLVIESDQKKDSLAEGILAAAAPHSKDTPVETVWYDEKAEKEIVQGAFAMYDREIDL